MEINQIIQEIASQKEGDKNEILKEYCRTKKEELINKLLPHYINLIGKICWKIITKYQIPEKYQEDVLQEGLLSFTIAIKKFDCNRGIKFSTYLYKVCYSNINRAIIKKFHLVTDKSYLTQRENKKEKIKYVQIDSELQDFILYRINRDIGELFDCEKFYELIEKIKKISPEMYRILNKMLNQEKLSKKEKKLFKSNLTALRNFFKKNGVSSCEDLKY